MDLPTLLGVIGTAFGVIAGATAVIWPDAKGVAFVFLIAALLILFAAVIAYVAANFPHRFGELKQAWILLPLGMGLAALFITLFGLYPKQPSANTQAQAINTVLRLHFVGGKEIPTQIQGDNISNWFCYYHPQVQITAQNIEGKPLVTGSTAPEWDIFVVFDQPVRYQQLIVSFSEPGFPRSQIWQSGPRSAMISVYGDLPAGILQVYAQL